MSMGRRHVSVAVLGALAVLVAGGALAWACTPQAYIYVNPSAGAVGDTVTVSGRGFIDAPVEIYWDRKGGKPPLATARGPKFSVDVRVPAAAAGVHYVTSVARTPDGQVVGSPSRAFEVEAADSPAPAPEPAPAPASPPATAPQGGGGAPALEQTGGQAPDARTAPGRPARPRRTRDRARGGAPRGGAPARDRKRTDGGAPGAGDRGVVVKGPAATGAPVRSAGRQPSGASAARSGTARERGGGSGRRAGGASTSGRGGALPSAASAAGDLWSGFGSSGAPSLSAPAVGAPDSDRGSWLAVGLALLAFGLATLVVGVAADGVRRRRAAVRHGGGPPGAGGL